MFTYCLKNQQQRFIGVKNTSRVFLRPDKTSAVSFLSGSNLDHDRVSSRLFILRVYKFYGYSQDHLSKLFDLLTLSLFTYDLEVWGSAYQKYLDRIENFCKRAYRYAPVDIPPGLTSRHLS